MIFAVINERLLYFITHPERLDEMGALSRQIIADYTPEAAAQQMHTGIEQLLTRSGK